MRKQRIGAIVAAVGLALTVSSPAGAEKDQMLAHVDAGAAAYWEAALDIWQWAEPGYQEEQSTERLAGLLEAAGFTVERGVADIPTAFVATYGTGAPVIGILGEYDALPGLSQAAVPEKTPVEGQAYGHACGHHLFGVASVAAALALAERIDAGDIEGTVRFYGCPAEEGGNGKVFMVRAGLFDDCDAVLHWHPANRNVAGDASSLARIATKFQFRGISAHAGRSPDQGRSALDAVEVTNFAANLLREHVPEETRIHYVITAGGGAPNVVPDFAEVFYYIRHPSMETIRGLYERLRACAEAGALATGTTLEESYVGGIVEVLPVKTLSDVTMRNLRELADTALTEDELEFAETLQATLQEPEPLTNLTDVFDSAGIIGRGSTDVGDVSWVAPTTGFSTLCWVPGTPPHSWQATAAGGTTIARKGMLLAAKVLAATAWDLYQSPENLAAAKEEHRALVEGANYAPLLKDGQAPPLDYRNAPSGD